VNIKAIDHVQLAMPLGQEQAARAFYVDVLGLTEIPKPADLAQRGGAWFQSGEAQIHLGVEAEFRPAHKAHPALLVEDLQPLIDRIRAAGGAVDASQPPLAGFRRVHVFDPFGNRIELMESSGSGR
jgi:predicted enzyme related to lactoylglutathione lyase